MGFGGAQPRGFANKMIRITAESLDGLREMGGDDGNYGDDVKR